MLPLCLCPLHTCTSRHHFSVQQRSVTSKTPLIDEKLRVVFLHPGNCTLQYLSTFFVRFIVKNGDNGLKRLTEFISTYSIAIESRVPHDPCVRRRNDLSDRFWKVLKIM